MLPRLIPLVLALAIAGQPIGQAWCSVTCGGMHTAHRNASPRAHACHPVGEQAASDTVSVGVPLVPGALHANAPCRQATGPLIGEPARGRQLDGILTASTANQLPPAVLQMPQFRDTRTGARLDLSRPTLAKPLPLHLSAALRV